MDRGLLLKMFYFEIIVESHAKNNTLCAELQYKVAQEVDVDHEVT